MVLHPPVHDDPRDSGARADARGHAGGHRPLDRRHDLSLRERARRRERGFEPRSRGRDARLRRPGGTRWARQRNPRRDREAEPADRDAGRRADRAGVQLEVRAREHGFVAGAGVALVVGGGEAPRDQRRLLDGRRDRGRRRARASLHGRRPALPGGGCEPESRVDGRTARPIARRVRVHGGGRSLRRRRDPARGRAHQHRLGLRRRVSPRADRRGRPCRRGALGRTGERDLDVDGSARAHVPDGDAAHLRTLGGAAVHRVRRRDHRRDAGLGRPGGVAPGPPPAEDRDTERRRHVQSTRSRAKAGS